LHDGQSKFVCIEEESRREELSLKFVDFLALVVSKRREKGVGGGGAGDCFSIDVWSTRLFSFSVILHCQANFIPSFTVSIKVIACFTTFALLGDCESMMWPLACPRVLGDCWHVCVPAM